jgi:predicted anti-sigma-YlaC factor YlaD
MATPTPITDPKPGHKTSEFWVMIALQLVALLLYSGFFTDVGAPQWVETLAGALVQLGSAVGYQISRGMAKKGSA